LILDHRGTVYHEDLQAGAPDLRKGARVFADNVLHPGAPLFLDHVARGEFDITIHELQEFVHDPPVTDWVTVCSPRFDSFLDNWVPPGGKGFNAMRARTAPDLLRWSAEVDALAHRSPDEPVDWYAFQQRLWPVLQKWRESHGL